MQLSCKHNVTGYSINLKKKIAYYPKVMEVLSLAGAMTDGKSNEEFLFNPVKYIGNYKNFRITSVKDFSPMKWS